MIAAFTPFVSGGRTGLGQALIAAALTCFLSPCRQAPKSSAQRGWIFIGCRGRGGNLSGSTTRGCVIKLLASTHAAASEIINPRGNALRDFGSRCQKSALGLGKRANCLGDEFLAHTRY